MTPSNRRLALVLTHAGVLPPWMALALHVTMAPAGMGNAAVAYAAIITSFVCGVHWGLFLRAAHPLAVNLLLTSNAGALAAWGLALAAAWSLPLASIGLAILLAALLVVDRRLLAAGVIESWFWACRRNASIGLAVALLLWAAFG